MSRFRVISDAPATADSFSSHQPVADAIASLILQETERGKAIGLSGSWGSGKSTIVELLRRKLAQDPGTRMFTFDAWVHQGDPLRRAFLDSLSHSLSDAKPNDRPWIRRESWTTVLDFLTGRKTKTESMVERRLTFWGVVVALLLVLCIPLGVAIASKYSVTSADEGHSRKFFQIGLSIVVLPFAAAAFVWIWQRPSLRVWTKAFWTTTRAGGENAFLRLLIKEPKETTITTASKTLDPTSVEFRDTFLQMLDEALQDSARRLVIVIDNLDRVDPKDALSIWSTMRIFFDFEAGHRGAWAPRLWLLVPFDRAALKRLWKPDRDEADDAAKMVESFINKTFQIVFNVAPPVVRLRMDYFARLFEYAFPDEEDRKHREAVYGLYDRLGPDSPPPREIKLFLNKVGALYLQNAGRIPLPLVALYQLKCGTITAGARELLAADFLEARTLSLLSDPEWRANWRTYLAAVHFNVLPTEALHVLNGTKIAQAIESGSRAELNARVDEPGFWSICDRVVWEHHSAWSAQPALLANATRLLAEPLSKIGADEADKVWTALIAIAEAVERWLPFDEEMAEGARLLLARMKARGNASVPVMSERLIASAAEVEQFVEAGPPAVTSWYKATTAIVNDIEGDPRTRPFTQNLQANVSTAAWLHLHYGLFLNAAPASFTSRFTARDPDELVPALYTMLANTDFEDGLLQFAKHFKNSRSQPEGVWAEVNSRLAVTFNNREAPGILRCFYLLNPHAKFPAETSYVSSLFQRALHSADWARAGLYLVSLYERAPSDPVALATIGDIAKISDSTPVIEQFSKALLTLDRVRLLLRSNDDQDLNDLGFRAFTQILMLDDAGRYFGPALLAAMLPRVPIEQRSVLLLAWRSRPDALPYLIDPAHMSPQNEALYLEILRTPGFPERPEIVQALLAWLKTLPAEQWMAGLMRPEFEWLLLQLVEAAGPGWIPSGVAEAVLQQLSAAEGTAHA